MNPMDNLIFERDYTEQHRAKEQIEETLSSKIAIESIDGGFLKLFGKAMNAVPKMIDPKQKADYEYLLEKCDKVAERRGGHIKGIVDYKNWEAYIYLTLPFVEFSSRDDLLLLKELAEKSNGVTFVPSDGNGITMYAFFFYFTDLIDEDGEDQIFSETLSRKQALRELIDVLEMTEKENLDALVATMNYILDYAEDATGIDRTVIFKRMLKPFSEDPDQFVAHIDDFVELLKDSTETAE